MKNLGLQYIRPTRTDQQEAPVRPSRPANTPPSSPTPSGSGRHTPHERSGLSYSEIRELEAPPFDPFGVSLVPALLPVARPDGKIQQHWALFPQDDPLSAPGTKLEQVDRTYTFSFMPKGFFSRLVVKVFPHANPVALWATGLLAQASTGQPNDWILIGSSFGAVSPSLMRRTFI